MRDRGNVRTACEHDGACECCRDQSLGKRQPELTNRERGHVHEQHVSARKVEEGDANSDDKSATLAPKHPHKGKDRSLGTRLQIRVRLLQLRPYIEANRYNEEPEGKR